jgi:hypothetical protein
MPNIYLGISGSEVLLPVLRKIGASPSISVNESKQVREATMSDGSRRVGFLATKRSWSYPWDALTAAELATFRALNALFVPLRLQDNHEGSTWYDVYISEFAYSPDLSMSGDGGTWFSVTLSLREL